MEITIAGKQCRANSQSCYDKLEMFFESCPITDDCREYDVRAILLPFVEQELSLKEWILYDGNSVWNVERLVKQFKILLKNYDDKHFYKYLYDFFSMQCGSIAHYNKNGWFNAYSTRDSLKEFFKSNEFGVPVKKNPPNWHYDALKATVIMDEILFKYY